ncbi:hypothetical protein [Photobacterium lutimaris]|uniref:Uncharacterized protein n=1 Tax=Photobacterium lutimaris TaxID=388278 RepID=A0A2T3ITQ1_9GAMM|nr:hypothetical protein [Photobacterium lutimaris]PSU31728.1 hypothetical protein C9I99_21315 [Photobacterium lutimaris]TDR72632.1 hypothetical protein DFP78_113108 [Photobacterium lutimaris]
MEFDIKNLKHWQLVEDGDLAGYYVQPMLGIQMNSTAMNLITKEADAERIQLEKRGHKVAVIQPKGDGNTYAQAMAKLLKETGRDNDLNLLKHM